MENEAIRWFYYSMGVVHAGFSPSHILCGSRPLTPSSPSFQEVTERDLLVFGNRRWRVCRNCQKHTVLRPQWLPRDHVKPNRGRSRPFAAGLRLRPPGTNRGPTRPTLPEREVGRAAVVPGSNTQRAAVSWRPNHPTAAPPTAAVDGSERDFQNVVVRAARERGWLVHHCATPRGSGVGFPDLVLALNGTVLFVELKSARGRPSPEQMRWTSHLGANAFIWYPEDWHSGRIEQTLRSPADLVVAGTIPL